MEILVRMDDEDRTSIAALVEACSTSKMDCERAKSDFWYGMIEKYPVLRNRRLGLNAQDHYIFEWHSPRDLGRHASLGKYYV